MTTIGRSLVLAFLLGSLLAACDAGGAADSGGRSVADGGEPSAPAADVPQPDASFSVEVTPGESEVRIGYRLSNDSDQPLLVVNRLPTPVGAGFQHTSDTAYVSGQDDGRVLISQRAFPWPDTDRKDWVQAPQVGVTRVAPGEVVTADLGLPLPLERFHPFGNDLGYGTIALPDPVAEIVFCLGVIAPPFHPALGLDRVREGGPMIGHGDAAHESQYLFCSDPVSLA